MSNYIVFELKINAITNTSSLNTNLDYPHITNS